MGRETGSENLERVLDLLQRVGEEKDRVTIGAMVEAVGQRSFGALLLVPGLIALSPLSGIPGLPTTTGILVLLIAGQILLGRKHFWLPQWIVRRSVSRRKFDWAIRALRPAARFVDRLIRPRLTALTGRGAVYFVSAAAILIALTMPPLELVPFAATTAGAALSIFGLSLVAHDGLLVLIAAACYLSSLALIAKALL